MIGSKKYRYVYCCPGKTGTGTLRSWLVSYYDGHYITKNDEGYKVKYHTMDVPPSWQGMTTFITVRNPYERMFSLWCFVNKQGKGRRANGWSFIESVEDYAEMGHTCADEYRRCGASIFLKIENIADEVKKLPFYDDTRRTPFQTLRRGTHKPVRSFFEFPEFGERERHAVQRHFREDFEMFGYKL